MFWGRSAKAEGSSIAIIASSAVILGPLVCFDTIAVWLGSALFVGPTNALLTESGNIIGKEHDKTTHHTCAQSSHNTAGTASPLAKPVS